MKNVNQRYAALMAGDWWADRLSMVYDSKRAVFARAVATRVYTKFQEGEDHINLVCDYDPWDILLDAVREAVKDTCRGFMFSCDGILPEKHVLTVTDVVLKPKEGYGNWTPEIVVTSYVSKYGVELE